MIFGNFSNDLWPTPLKIWCKFTYVFFLLNLVFCLQNPQSCQHYGESIAVGPTARCLRRGQGIQKLRRSSGIVEKFRNCAQKIKAFGWLQSSLNCSLAWESNFLLVETQSVIWRHILGITLRQTTDQTEEMRHTITLKVTKEKHWKRRGDILVERHT